MAYHKSRKRHVEEEAEIDLAALAAEVAAEEFAGIDSETPNEE